MAKRDTRRKKTQVQVQVKEYDRTSDGKTVAAGRPQMKKSGWGKMSVGRIREEEKTKTKLVNKTKP